MNAREIKKAVKQIEEYAGESAAKKLILCVPLKTNKAQHRKDAIEAIARDRGESEAEVKKMLKGFVPAIYVKATDLEYYGGLEGDLCMLSAGGRYADSYHSGEVIYVRPGDLQLTKAWIVDENMEHSQDLDGAMAKLSGGGGYDPYNY